jgi:hypothetical protein
MFVICSNRGSLNDGKCPNLPIEASGNFFFLFLKEASGNYNVNKVP